MSGQELLPIAKELYKQMQSIAWLMLGPLFLLSCVVAYMREPANFPAFEMIHRVTITIGLLMFFPEITSMIAQVANGLADHLGEKQALEQLFKQIQQQTDPAKQASITPFLLSADIGVALLNYLSYALVYLAKYLMVAIYHFFWSLLMTIAPLAILCNLFRGTSHITKHLFSSLLEISTWNILWQIMGVMLLGLNVLHPTAANYFDAICFNFLLVIGLIGAPLLVHSFVKGGLSNPSSLSAGPMLGVALGPVGKTIAVTKQVMQTTSAASQRMRRTFGKGGK
ncbi:MAG: hypothetical protein SGI74_02265 [Oligoflexia bacterium]|nr:hypothetical protein [Oligoflexia bacterium]